MILNIAFAGGTITLGGLTLVGPADMEYWNLEVVDTNSQALMLNYTIPEPASIMLITLGGLMMMRRRRRR